MIGEPPTLERAKRRQWRRNFSSLFCEQSFSWLKEPATRLTALGVPGALWVAFQYFGYKGLLDEAQVVGLATIVLLWTVPVWLVIIAISAWRGTKKKIYESGVWDHGKFIFKEKKYIGMWEFGPDQDGALSRIFIRDVEPSVMVQFHAEYYGGQGYADIGRVTEMMPIKLIPNPFVPSQQAIVSVRIGTDCCISLRFYCQPKSTKTQLRLYAMSWEP